MRIVTILQNGWKNRHPPSNVLPQKMSPNQLLFESRQEAKWQFRRMLLLSGADILERDVSGEAWEKIQKDLEERETHPDKVIQMLARNWRKHATSQAALVRYIRNHFEQDTPGGPIRHKLQDQSEGHPFAAILPETLRAEIYRQAYKSLQTVHPTP
jgi:hypothetical protein